MTGTPHVGSMSHLVELQTTSVKRKVATPLGSVMLSSRQLPDPTVELPSRGLRAAARTGSPVVMSCGR